MLAAESFGWVGLVFGNRRPTRALLLWRDAIPYRLNSIMARRCFTSTAGVGIDFCATTWLRRKSLDSDFVESGYVAFKVNRPSSPILRAQLFSMKSGVSLRSTKRRSPLSRTQRRFYRSASILCAWLCSSSALTKRSKLTFQRGQRS